MKKNRLIFLITYLAYVSIYVARVNLSMASPALIELSVLDKAQIGLLGSVFSVVYSVGRLFNGNLADKTPPWKMLTVGLILSGIANLCFGLFPPFIALFLLWLVNAFAQSMLWSSVLVVIASIYEPAEAKKKTSAMVTSVATGNILGIIINTFFITTLDVRYAFFVPGLLTIILGGAVFFATRHIKEKELAESIPHQSMLRLIKNKQIRRVCIPAFCHGIMKENISLWLTVFVIDLYAIDLSTSAYYVLLIPAIGLLGRSVYFPIYKLCKENEHTVSSVCFLLCIACAAFLCLGKINVLASVIALGLIYAAVSIINTSMLSIYPMQHAKGGAVASVSGIMDFATYLGGGISSAIYGTVIALWGYNPMFVSWIAVSVISVATLFFVTKAQKNH
ncbi:MAG: MFS transporter [Clostridia bacterium]|nr:MFS transporter [Clostridia bacterium]